MRPVIFSPMFISAVAFVALFVVFFLLVFFRCMFSCFKFSSVSINIFVMFVLIFLWGSIFISNGNVAHNIFMYFCIFVLCFWFTPMGFAAFDIVIFLLFILPTFLVRFSFLL